MERIGGAAITGQARIGRRARSGRAWQADSAEPVQDGPTPEPLPPLPPPLPPPPPPPPSPPPPAPATPRSIRQACSTTGIGVGIVEPLGPGRCGIVSDSGPVVSPKTTLPDRARQGLVRGQAGGGREERSSGGSRAAREAGRTGQGSFFPAPVVRQTEMEQVASGLA